MVRGHGFDFVGNSPHTHRHMGIIISPWFSLFYTSFSHLEEVKEKAQGKIFNPTIETRQG